MVKSRIKSKMVKSKIVKFLDFGFYNFTICFAILDFTISDFHLIHENQRQLNRHRHDSQEENDHGKPVFGGQLAYP